MALLGKIWGFLKYYHPMVCDGQYNWDYELFRWLPEVLKSDSKTEVCEFVFNKVSAMGSLDKSDNIKNDFLHVTLCTIQSHPSNG